LGLIRQLELPTNSAVIDVGGGASSLVDELVEQGFRDVSVLDISETALAETRRRLGDDASVTYLQRDVLTWHPERHFDLWHDRAVFHFLVDDLDRQTYLTTLKSAVRPGGIVIIATFAADGPEYCSGLPVARYSAHDLASVLGGGIRMIDERRERHITPSGTPQPFTWIMAQMNARADGERRD
jgi:2-polyprenyl-3-methyl-5-hydroxy-6-metoxy-1,4-benzoquinol methylase